MHLKKFPKGKSKANWLNTQKLLHGRCNVARLGKDHILQLRLIRAEGIHGRYAPDRGVQLLEEFVRNARGDLRSIPQLTWSS